MEEIYNINKPTENTPITVFSQCIEKEITQNNTHEPTHDPTHEPTHEPIHEPNHEPNHEPTNETIYDICYYNAIINKLYDVIESNGQNRIEAEELYDILNDILEKVIPILSLCPNIFEIKGATNIKVTGDTHGHFDLKYILDSFGEPTITSQQLFLGDYVDRGKFAVENLMILLIRKIIYPNTFHLLRGNHEDSNVCSSFVIYGTLSFTSQIDQLFKEYSEEVCDMFFDIFSALPLGCYGLNRFFVHAGIPMDNNFEIMSLDEINEQDRFYHSIDEIENKRWFSVVQNLLWSDPGTIRKNNDRGGNTIVYGISDTKIFLKKYGLKEIFRAHEVVDGYRKDQGANNNPICHTVFSASKYCGKKNMGGYVVCYNDRTFDVIIYQTPIELMPNNGQDDNDICDANTPRTYASIKNLQFNKI